MCVNTLCFSAGTLRVCEIFVHMAGFFFVFFFLFHSRGSHIWSSGMHINTNLSCVVCR